MFGRVGLIIVTIIVIIIVGIGVAIRNVIDKEQIKYMYLTQLAFAIILLIILTRG